MKKLRLGVNIDHVATIRNARGGLHPDPVRAALLAFEAGADGITAHLREDRRHIRDEDIARLKTVPLPLNLEMAATEEMLAIALKHRPHAACIVPEKREEVTTEGGLDVVRFQDILAPMIQKLSTADIRVSLFIEANPLMIQQAAKLGAPVIEIHTGSYAHASGAEQKKILKRIEECVILADSLGLEVHAGHGLDFDNVTPIAAISLIQELNIGHFLIGEAIFSGLKQSIQTMKELMHAAR